MASVEYKAEKLSATKYSTWKTVIMSALMDRDLWEVVVEAKINSDELRVRNEQAKHLMYISIRHKLPQLGHATQHMTSG